MLKRIAIVAIGLCSIILSGCQKTDNDNTDNKKRTVIVYMVANNNLDFFAIKNINEMEKGWDNTCGNLIVYYEGPTNGTPPFPLVYKITHDTTDEIVSPIQWVYPQQNSCSAPVFATVIGDIEKKFPSDSYGLVMWSHGSAWYPPGTEIKSGSGQSIIDLSSIRQQMKIAPDHSIIKSFGRDGKGEMDIADFKNSLARTYDFILFDACYMGSVEVAYELRDKARYIISSPTEVISYGFPYKQIVPLLFARKINPVAVADEYMSYYNNQSGESLKSASVSVVNTSAFPSLISITNQIFSNPNTDTLWGLESIQQLDVAKSNYLYDLDDLYDHINIPDSLKIKFQNSLNELIPYKQHTNKILGTLPLNKFSGLSTFILNDNDSASYEYYKKLDWYNASGYSHFLDRFAIK